MKCHQILTGACNAGDRCFAVGSVEGIPFTAYAAGCNIVILASNFERVQVIPGVCHDNVQISCVDCSTDTGKIAAAYGKLVCIFEPTPLVNQNNTHRLDYRWIQTGVIEAESYINTMSWNLEGTRLLTAGDILQMWAAPLTRIGGGEDGSGPVTFDLECDGGDEEEPSWTCIWRCVTAAPTVFLSFSSDGTLFATASANDRLVKIWYDNKHILAPARPQDGTTFASDLTRSSVSFSYIYLPHPSAVKGFTWRSTSKYMPKGSVSNMLVTSCRDNICRIWVETVLPDDGLVSLHHLDPVAAQNPRFRTHRHKHRFMQRLKHMKACFQMRRHVKTGGNIMGGLGGIGIEPLPTLPSSYSVHDFHMYGIHGTGITPGFQFHLAASINAETDIPLVPSISGISTNGESEQSFVIHWLNNKEMHFTSEAENILLEISRRAMEKESASLDHDRHSEVSDLEDPRLRATTGIRIGSRTSSHMTVRTRSIDDDEPISQHSTSIRTHQPLSAATSSTSIATDVTTATTSALGDALDRRIETLLRDWHQTSDVLFSIHPVDGSLLVWIVDFLDDHSGSFRQAQVSFSARIPNALPLGDSMTMSPNLAIYNGTLPSFLKQLLKLELAHEEELRGGKNKSKSNLTLSSSDDREGGLGSSNPSPIISMTTKHSNGSLNLWHLTVAEDSRFTQVLNLSHFTRVCGHRFQLNDIKCHPVLPLLLSTSHHNKKEMSPGNPPLASADDAPLICIQDATFKDWCSELILWRVDAVGPLSKSGGVMELARINSPQVSAFSNAAWIPTLLPSTTLGSVSNSPSACFVASDGECLRVYQAVIDGRALLAEISTAKRKKRMMESTLSLSTDSSLQEHVGQVNLADIFDITSEQSTARPGCVIELDAIGDATNDWQNTQFLHVFQEGLIRGELGAETGKDTTTMFDPIHAPIVDLHSTAVFEEPFYITLLEKTAAGSVMHMWRLVIASESHGQERMEEEGQIPSGRSTPVAENMAGQNNVDASPIVISTTKIYSHPLPLPHGVQVIHASPAAGHLSSASIYPACYAPYVLVTACTDNTVRFWRCRMTGEGDATQIQWEEWRMVSKDGKSAIKVPGQPLHVSVAYSGRIACAYQTPGQQGTVSTDADGSITFSCSLAIYECESTGGAEWVLEDKFDLQDVVTHPGDSNLSDLDLTYLSKVAQGKSTSRLTSALSSEDLPQACPTSPQFAHDHLSAEALHSVSSQLLVPSPSTLHSLRNHRFDKRGVNVKQKHPVQIDWVSQEDGSHLLTVAIGSKILIYTSVADEIALMNCSEGNKDKEGRPRPVLQKSISVHKLSDTKLPRWMRLEKLSLSTADGLAPLPMQVSWVRDGILVVGMDNEMHVYSQWHVPAADQKHGQQLQETSITKEEGRDLTEVDLKTYLQESSHSTKTTASMSRVASFSILASLDHKMKKGLGEVMANPLDEVDVPSTSNSGIFEASHIAAPVLPQYHPRQLMELLNSGKIRRVKAILAHLVRCLSQLGQRSSDATYRTSLSDADEPRSRSWSRSRTLSVSGNQGGSSSRDGRGSPSLLPEEITLDYIEVTAIPPLPLWLLLEADKDTQNQQTKKTENKEDTYAELFGAPAMAVDDDLTLDDDEVDTGGRRKSLTHESKGITFFGPRQTQILATLLTHTHLPGLSSLDQMHLLALSDTVASCNVDFADRFDINKAKEALAKETFSRTVTDEPSMDALDDCGLRFLLAMRHHTYLLRCLPIAQRAALQKGGIGSHNFVWAFHSESQEELLEFIPSMRQGNPRWSELRELGFGWWIRNNTVLSRCINKVAKAAFQLRKDPLDAAIYYLAMKKKSLVWGLFRSINDKRMTEFFSNNFTEERWRKAALKNAFALLGKQRFEHAAAFFLLAGALTDALEVVLNKLQDEQLALVIIRMYEGELEAVPPTLCKLLYTRVLGKDEQGENIDLTKVHPNPFLRSVAFWMLKDYSSSLNTLLQTDPVLGIHHQEYVSRKAKSSSVFSAADPSVFNFYIYLRTHPLLIRQCIANSAKDGGGSLMAARLGSGQDNLDKKSVYESSMTLLERRLYFTTAHAHLRSGCPTLALEVLSKLPDNVIDPDNPDTGDLLGSPSKEQRPAFELIHSGTFESSDSFEQSAAPSGSGDKAADLFGTSSSLGFGSSSVGFDWSTPSSTQRKDDDLELDFSIDKDEDEDEDMDDLTDVKKIHAQSTNEEEDGLSDTPSKHLDIMAQQLKFVSCLKMMMEELATLATGCEVDGGQLRFQLYVWLEREVEALKEVCNYCCTLSDGVDFKLWEDSYWEKVLIESIPTDEGGDIMAPSPVPLAEPSTLHEILQQEKIEFEEKMERAARRKRWLMANQQLLRTLLSYCSLHGSSGGGLASVRMELILLLQELQQESSKQQLLSPLPFPTTLPLLSASIASNKTVVSDPVRHLQAGTHDLLQSLVEVSGVGRPDAHLMCQATVLRNLAAALSACIYQSLCDSETFTVKAQHRVAALGVDIQHTTVAHRESHLVGRDLRTGTPHEEEPLQVCTPPAKWPGVTSLLALIARERDEDTPKLNVLLCEAFVAVYLSLLIYGISASDAYVLYRLVAQPLTEKDWATMFGGGVKKLLKVITNVLPSQASLEREGGAGAAVSGERILSTISSLQKTRIKFNMKLLGQLGFQDPRGATSDGDSKPAYREQFLPPELSIVSNLMKKPPLPNEYENIDYDSSASDDEDIDIDYEEDEDVFKEPKVIADNTEHSDPDSYSWCLLRLATMCAAKSVVGRFLEVAGVELQELPMQSPLLHSILRTLDQWLACLVNHIENKKGPPPEYIPGCFAESQVTGPAILKYRGLLETHNTPFAHNKRGVKPVERLWNYLVRQEHVQEVFVRYIFGRKRPAPEPTQYSDHGDDDMSDVVDGIDGSGTGEGGSEMGVESHHEPSEHGGPPSETTVQSLEPVRIIHKEQDSITSFCINGPLQSYTVPKQQHSRRLTSKHVKGKVNPGLMAIATVREVQELDVSLLLDHPGWLTNECELDVLALNKEPDTVPSSNFLVVQTPMDKNVLESGRGALDGNLSSSSSINFGAMGSSPMGQTGRGTSVVLSHRIEGTRRMTSHPVLPLYLLGCQDGSVVVREWRHSSIVARPRPGGTFAKVARVRFNQQGNKFGVIDGDGNLSLYQLGLASQVNKQFYTHQCHNKHGSDFVFIGSSSLIATAGQSSEHRNVALWDTLMPQRKANVVSWTCHDNGASALLYAPQHQVILSAGKKGTVCIFDVRQRTLRQKFQAHDAAIKCMALDQSEEFFCTGSADGDIKVWGLSIHNLIYNLPGEHSRSSLFKNLSQGVTQLQLDTKNRLFSCGADGSIKLRQLPERDLNISLL
ncbi:dmX-like protein 2 isoform X6 [Penaeus japonicus]|uniref:dmX-like protein 2 isoform X6 n=1 Tax=Penaeus japonicus TaxID=27405 RepID=UPI001C70F57A|nr:dmX-like protein 2 isoform X6 [Penaeus japonicus]